MKTEDLKVPAFKAGLFDLDGVIVDTEPQYTEFWGAMGRIYHPEIPDFAYRIKGQTLTQITERWIDPEYVPELVRRLDEFESRMVFEFIPGAWDYLEKLKSAGVKTALVTSSNAVKMENVWRERPALRDLFDEVFTSEHFKASKPDPDCYLLGSKVFGYKPADCVVFEDSFAGVAAGRAAGCKVVGLSTTNPADALAPLCDIVLPDFRGII
ncbi:MAG: HAD-IA family hydrolase [Bacteroidales bacterium]|nr:HAD-IA family hydrolase [Candidatus Cryptobacteroides caccocaballi]